MPEMASIPEIAKRLGIDLTTVRRLIAKESDDLQIELHRGKQDRLFLTRDDADKLIASYEARRGPVSADPEEAAKYDRFGYFYLIQLVPEALPERVKLGFRDNIDKRLAEHRTAAPTARLLKAWPCKRSWDHAAMDSIARSNCQLVLNEVYEGDVQGFMDRANAFFALMPSPDSERELSKWSPLSETQAREDQTPNEMQPNCVASTYGLVQDPCPTPHTITPATPTTTPTSSTLWQTEATYTLRLSELRTSPARG